MRPLPLKEQTLFLKRLAFLLQAHIPLVDALLSIKNQARSKGNAKRIWAAAQLVSEGKPLAEALHTQRLLSDFSLHLIHVGEISGNLSANLTYVQRSCSCRRSGLPVDPEVKSNSCAARYKAHCGIPCVLA